LNLNWIMPAEERQKTKKHRIPQGERPFRNTVFIFSLSRIVWRKFPLCKRGMKGDFSKYALIGVKVLRFSDREVFEKMDAIMERIWSYF